MKISERRIKIFSTAFAAVLLIAFFIFKVVKYNLFYYEHDIFSTLQMSRSWIYGHSILWENRYGNTPNIHNYYITLLFAPFTVLLGAKGLFLIHILVYFIAFYFGIYSKFFDSATLKERLLLLVIFLLSPYSLWVFDDPQFGWHTEFLFLPFSLFFVLALCSGKRLWIIITSVLMIITKEDGPVIACSVQLLFFYVQPIANIEKRKKILRSIAIWLGIFGFSLLFMKIMSHFGHLRNEELLWKFFADKTTDVVSYLKEVFSDLFLMLIPLLIVSVVVSEFRFSVALLFFSIPVFIIAFISGLLYYPNTSLSVTWVTRFVEMMGVMMSGLFLFLRHRQTVLKKYFNPVYMIVFCVVIFMMQNYILFSVRRYHIGNEIEQVCKGQSKEKPGNAYLMKCIAAKTPKDYVVAVPYFYFNLFEWHNCVWCDFIQNSPQTNPDLIIYDDTLNFSQNKFDYSLYSISKRRKFYVLTRKDKRFLLDDCR